MATYAGVGLVYSTANAIASHPILACTTGSAVQSSSMQGAVVKSSKRSGLQGSFTKVSVSTGNKLQKDQGAANLTGRDTIKKAGRDAKAALKAAKAGVEGAFRPSAESLRSTSPLVAEALLAVTDGGECWSSDTDVLEDDLSHCAPAEARDLIDGE